ncbi:MAG TPA: hypothetical protein VGI96_16145 [Streptosporangiaceae bacterium]|jgi:hypothetical protein
MMKLGRSQDAYDRFSAAVELAFELHRRLDRIEALLEQQQPQD